jgi:RNA polymerase sigma-70 factor (ECF subfamily)
VHFEAHRAHLRSVAYRMLGSLTDADDAVQEAWLRLSRADTGDVRDLRAWLTTVVSRVCLDMLRSRAARREDSLDVHVPDPIVTRVDDDPAEHAVLADSIGIALLVVLDTLSPAERLAFVLHDIFAMPFEQIGPVLDRSPAAAKQLASRARRRLRDAPSHAAAEPAAAEPATAAAGSAPAAAAGSAPAGPGTVPAGTADLARQWTVVEAFLAASREGDFEGLLAILDPDIVLRADAGEGPFGPSVLVRGAREVIAQAQRFAPLGRFARPVLVNGGPGFLVVRNGEPLALMAVTVQGGKIAEMDVLADPVRLARLDLTELSGT